MINVMGLFTAPLIASIILFLLYFVSAKTLKILSIVFSVIPLAMLIIGNIQWIGSSVDLVWLPGLSIHFHLVIDSLSLLFLFLVAIITPISILSMSSASIPHAHVFYGLILLLESFLIGFFTARDLALFTFLWEGMLLPLYFIIAFWGGAERQTAALKFLIYMIAGSALMVAAVLALYFSSATNSAGTFNLDLLKASAETLPFAPVVLAIFLLAFSVKTPLFPFHAWLPDAYCQAPLAGTILLSALLSKAGIYGILRIGIELFPTLMKEWSPWLLGLAIFGVFYSGLAAWMQDDFKRLMAYSSLSHVNFILAGLFVWHEVAHGGAILQALNHGITIAALFLVLGWLEERLGTTVIHTVSGLAKFLPCLCWLTLFFVVSSIAVPGTNNFIGELFILFGMFQQHPWLTAILTLSIILSVMYLLRFMQKVYFQAPDFFQNRWIDIRAKNFMIAAPLVALVLWVGLYPSPLLEQIQRSIKKINSHVGR